MTVPYRRLTGRNRTWTGFSQAWLGDDHLLIVTSMRLVERYQRFALSDIQAIIVGEGGRRAIWQSIVILTCLSLGTTSGSNFGRGFFAVIGVAALAMLILDIVRGPRCICVLQTAVSRERLYAVSRVRTARAFLAAIVPAIEAVQGTVSVEELAAEASMPQPVVAVSPPQPPAIEQRPGYAPEVLFGLLMLDSVLMLVAMRSTVGVSLGLLPTIYFAEFLIGIVALVQARGRETTSVAALIAAFLCIVVDPFAVSGPAVWPKLVAAFQQASSNELAWDLRIAASATALRLAVGWRAVMAVTGLVICHFERTARAQ